MSITEKVRESRIEDIQEMLTKMSNQQVANVHDYVRDEYDEPNHERAALNAIVQLSKKYDKEKETKALRL